MPVQLLSCVMHRTLAEHLGGTPHLSALLHKARRLGLPTPDALLKLAVRRGCTHYAPADYAPSQVSDPGPEVLSNMELAIALCSAAQKYDPKWVRCAAQLLGSEDIDAASLVRAARMERCEAVIRHIASAAVEADGERETFWRNVLTQLPTRPSPPAGVLPHASRFMLCSGVVGPGPN
ncbi:MAG: hypothetical protein ACTS5G_01245, partial [Burkholderiales bacterium]